MTIHEPVLFLDGIWDWSIFDGCFGQTRIAVTDIDGLVERRGKFLVIEAKSPRTHIPTGQKIMFDALVATGFFSVLVIWGDTNKPVRAMLMNQKGVFDYSPADVKKCRAIVSAWFQYAEER